MKPRDPIDSRVTMSGEYMGPASRRERERLALRAKIMDTARQLFAENGYEAVTIRSIAEAIEYSPRTIYLHFKDKENLLRQLCIEDYRAFGQNMIQYIAPEDPVERLLAQGRAYAEFAVTHPHHYCLMFMSPPTASSAASHDEKVLEVCGDPEADAYGMLVATVQEAIDQERLRPELQDAHLVAQLLWAGTHGIVSQYLTRTGEGYVPWRPLDERIATLAQITIRGLIRHDSPPETNPLPKPSPKRKKT